MSPMPPLPNWSGLHPLLTHFPVVLILLSSVLLLLGAVLEGKPARRSYAITLLLLCAGGGFMCLAMSTGAEAVALSQLSMESQDVLEEHRRMARSSTSALLLAALLYALTLAVRGFVGADDNRVVATILPVAFLIFYSIGIFQMFNTIQHGAQLVHGHAFSDAKVASTGDTR